MVHASRSSVMQALKAAGVYEHAADRIATALTQLPKVRVRARLTIDNDGDGDAAAKHDDARAFVSLSPMQATPLIRAPVGTLLTMRVELTRLGQNAPHSAYTPMFPKQSPEAMWLLIADDAAPDGGDILALRRARATRRPARAPLQFDAPMEVGRHRRSLYVVSDCYLGLDQRFEFEIETF